MLCRMGKGWCFLEGGEESGTAVALEAVTHWSLGPGREKQQEGRGDEMCFLKTSALKVPEVTGLRDELTCLHWRERSNF